MPHLEIQLHVPGLIEAVRDGFAMLNATLNERFDAMSAEMDALTAQVTANTAVLQSAVTLINGIADRIAAAGVDPAKLTALTDELRQQDDALAAAVAANTPAAPAPTS